MSVWHCCEQGRACTTAARPAASAHQHLSSGHHVANRGQPLLHSLSIVVRLVPRVGCCCRRPQAPRCERPPRVGRRRRRRLLPPPPACRLPRCRLPRRGAAAVCPGAAGAATGAPGYCARPSKEPCRRNAHWARPRGWLACWSDLERNARATAACKGHSRARPGETHMDCLLRLAKPDDGRQRCSQRRPRPLKPQPPWPAPSRLPPVWRCAPRALPARRRPVPPASSSGCPPLRASRPLVPPPRQAGRCAGAAWSRACRSALAATGATNARSPAILQGVQGLLKKAAGSSARRAGQSPVVAMAGERGGAQRAAIAASRTRAAQQTARMRRRLAAAEPLGRRRRRRRRARALPAGLAWASPEPASLPHLPQASARCPWTSTATSVSWRTLTRARPRPLSASCSTPVGAGRPWVLAAGGG